MSVPNFSRGENGSLFIDGTTTKTGSWYNVMVLEDTIISAIEMPDFENSDALIGITLLQGFTLFGRVTSITLTSGVVQMIKH